MRCTHLSQCCNAMMLMTRTHKSGGIFHCQQCKNQCIAMRARSHCCVAHVIVPHEGFPFVCSDCSGSCELASPDVQSHEENLDRRITNILKLMGAKAITEEKAFDTIKSILNAEVGDGMDMIAESIQIHMENQLAHPDAENHPTQPFMAGIDAAMLILDNVIKELLHEGKTE